MVKRVLCGLAIVALFNLSGCHYWRSADTPMASDLYCRAMDYQVVPAHECTRAADVMIMLPGIGDGPEQFAQEGLIEQLRQADIPVDVIVANAHFGYYRERIVLARLQHDLLTPAKQAGYHRLHLAGVSLGGFGSLLYWRDSMMQPPLASAILLTPYLGDPEHYQHKVTPAMAPQAITDEKNLWPWLDALPASERGSWYLGLAREGKFYAPGRALGNLLPEAQVVEVSGKHNWHAWRQMWPPLLQTFKRDFYSSELE